MTNFFRLYSSEDGQTHFEDIEQAPFAVTQVRFATSAPGTFGDWHNERQRQFVLVHSGRAEITASDGETRLMTPGATMLAEDLTGKGHQMRVIGDEPCVWMFIALDPAAP
jgi:quercetin dioxygenase-like cupin family protein